MCGRARVAWVGTLISLKLSPACCQKSVALNKLALTKKLQLHKQLEQTRRSFNQSERKFGFPALGTGRIFPAIHIDLIGPLRFF